MKKLIIAAIACAFTSTAFAQGAAPAPAAPAAPKAAAPAAEKKAAPGKKKAGPAKLPSRRAPGKTTIKNAPKS